MNHLIPIRDKYPVKFLDSKAERLERWMEVLRVKYMRVFGKKLVVNSPMPNYPRYSHTLEEPINTDLVCQYCDLNHDEEGRCEQAIKDDKEQSTLDNLRGK